jgi:preprotein translocase subunit SecA
MSDTSLARHLAGSAFRRADTRRDERAAEPLRPVDNFLRNLLGWLPAGRASARAVARLGAAVQASAQPLRPLDDDALAQQLRRAMHRLQHSARPQRDVAALAPVLACVAEGARRRLGLWPHPVQLAGARALMAGELAEMPTGEGKTLVAAIAATVLAASGAKVHVISTNDYLAQRDAEEMTSLFDLFGLSAGHIEGVMEPDERRRHYACDICYASGKEVVFDYLKDRLAGHGLLPSRVSQLQDLLNLPGAAERAAAAMQPAPTTNAPLIPALHVALVDEADSVMIDEARTPMILSREAVPVIEPALLQWAIDSARRLQQGPHYTRGHGRELDLLPAALGQALPLPEAVRPAWRSGPWREHLLRQALSALHLYQRDQHYILAEGKVQIVDESTGRVMPDRSWEQGLHQLIETKEQLETTNGRETIARMTYQRFFRRYYLVGGLTGTAAEAARELWAVYRLRVRRIPPNRPSQRQRLPDRCLATAQAKWAAVADEACAAAARGQPVLVGTRSVQASEQVADELARRGVPHVVLNARQDAEEAAIVAQAGASGRITVATNMAGRGTDIKPDAQAKAAGGLHVILTEFHESPRVDRQLFGRSGRQGEPGSTRAIVSTDDPLFERLPWPSGWILGAATRSGSVRLLRWVVARAQARAERQARQIRLQTLQQDRELHRLIGFAGRVT